MFNFDQFCNHFIIQIRISSAFVRSINVSVPVLNSRVMRNNLEVSVVSETPPPIVFICNQVKSQIWNHPYRIICRGNNRDMATFD